MTTVVAILLKENEILDSEFDFNLAIKQQGHFLFVNVSIFASF